MKLSLAERAIVFLLACCYFCAAQDAASISLSNGVQLRITTSLGNPTGQQTITTELQPMSGNSFVRVFRDQTGMAVYAYVLVVDRPTGDDEFHLLVRPAAGRFAREHPDADGGKPTPTVSEPREIATMHADAVVPFEVFQMPGTGLNVVDALEFKIVKPDTAAASGALRFSKLKVMTSGSAATFVAPGTVAGRYTMFYIPNRGGYFFSSDAVPDTGFVKAGWIDRTHMEFSLDNETFQCTAEAPIFTKADRSEVWVYHDPAYKPEGNWTKPLDDPATANRPAGFFTAASNVLGWWIQ